MRFLTLSLLFFTLTVHAGVEEYYCQSFFQKSITTPEQFTTQLKISTATYNDLQKLTDRSHIDLIFDQSLADELSKKGMLKELGISIKAYPHDLVKFDLMRRIDDEIMFKIKNTNNVDEFLHILQVLKKNGQEDFFSAYMLKFSPFVKRGLLTPKIIADSFMQSNPSSLLKEALIKKAMKSFSEVTSITELTGFIRIAKKTGLEEILPAGYLENNPVFKSGLLNAKNIEEATEREVKRVVFEDLLAYSKKAKSFAEYFDLIEVIKHSDYSAAQLDSLLNPMVRFGTEFRYVFHLIDALKEGIKKGKLDANRYFGDRLTLTYELMRLPLEYTDYLKLVSEVESGIQFSFTISRLSKSKEVKERIFEYLALSPFCKKHNVDQATIKQMVSRLREKNFSTLTDSVDEISLHYPHLGTSKKLLSIDNYDNSVNIVSVKDQCNIGACWVQTNVAKYEIELSNRLGFPVELSGDYLYYHYLRDEFRRALKEQSSSMDFVVEGGFTAMVPKLIQKYGIAPKKFIPEGANRPSSIEGFDMELFSQAKIDDIKIRMKTILDENRQLNLKNPSRQFNSHEVLKEFEDRIDAVLDSHYHLPSSKEFIFQGETFTPKSFVDKHLKEAIDSDYVHVQSDFSVYHDLKITKSQRYVLGKGDVLSDELVEINHVTKTLDEVNGIIKKSIDNGKAIQASFIWPENGTLSDLHIDNITGRMTGSPTTRQISDFYQRRANNPNSHAALIVGYELDHSGNIITYKILNSWGANAGDEGIYHMDQYFFKHMLKGIDVDLKTGLGFVDPKNRWKIPHPLSLRIVRNGVVGDKGYQTAL